MDELIRSGIIGVSTFPVLPRHTECAGYDFAAIRYLTALPLFPALW
jgi:hypothetical protein